MPSRYDWRAAPYGLQNANELGVYALPYGYAPLMLWALESQKDANDWVSGSAPGGYQHICKMQWELIMQCGLKSLIASSDRIYMLLDAALNGAQYNAVPDPATGQPAPPILPIVPNAYNQSQAALALALRSLVAEDRQRNEALVLRDDSRNALLAEIKALLEALSSEQTAEDLQEIITRLGAILAAL